jgi:hypothetical protein
LDRVIRLACGSCRSREELRSLGKVGHYDKKGLLGNVGEASLRAFADK